MQIHFQSITHFLCGRESQEQCCTCQPPCTVFAWKCFFSCNIFCNYHHGSYLPQVGKMKRKFGPLPSQEVRLNPGQSRSERHSCISKVWPTFGLSAILPCGSRDKCITCSYPWGRSKEDWKGRGGNHKTEQESSCESHFFSLCSERPARRTGLALEENPSLWQLSIESTSWEVAGNHWVGWTTPLRSYDVTAAEPRDSLVRCFRVKTSFEWGNRHETRHSFHLSNDSYGVAVKWCLSEEWVVMEFPSVWQGAELRTELYLLNQ